jgi:hypothetical protein
MVWRDHDWTFCEAQERNICGGVAKCCKDRTARRRRARGSRFLFARLRWRGELPGGDAVNYFEWRAECDGGAELSCERGGDRLIPTRRENKFSRWILRTCCGVCRLHCGDRFHASSWPEEMLYDPLPHDGELLRAQTAQELRLIFEPAGTEALFVHEARAGEEDER